MGIMVLGFEPGKLSEAQLSQIREVAPDMKILVTRDRDEIEAVLAEVEIVVGCCDGNPGVGRATKFND